MLNGSASYMHEQLGLRGLLQSRGVYSQLNQLADQNSPLNQFSPGFGNRAGTAGGGLLNSLTQPVDLFQYALNASWELDLFGRVRRSVEQARAQTEAQVEATNDALVMLEGDVAQAYVQLRGGQALTQSQQENVRSGQEALALTQRRQRQGIATDLDVAQARTQLFDIERQLPAYEKQATQAINRLSVLTGQPPGALDATLGMPAALPTSPPVIGVGLPSALARRRPDIRATNASYLTNWASNFYSVGPSVSLPIFQGGRLTSSLRLARAQALESMLAYRTDRAARDKLVLSVRSGDLTLYLARNRYTHGLADFIQVLDAQRTLVAARQQLIQADMMLTGDVVTLYRSVGGGWEDTGPLPEPPIDSLPPFVPGALDAVAAR